jgi:hypothetical protein
MLSLSGPETWVTARTYDMGDNLVPNGLSMVCGWPGLMRSMAMPSRSP